MVRFSCLCRTKLICRNNEDLSIFSEDDSKKTEMWVDSASKRARSPASASSDRITAQSVASSTTLTPVSTPPYTPKGIKSGSGITSGLLINGSRAVEAVVRPFPTATVGTPIRIDFDIASTTFKLSVKVAAADEVPDGVKTEIYLPFVHYAASLDPYMTSTSSSANSSKVSLNANPNGTDAGSADNAPLRLAVDVKPSAGTYEVAGQTLFWSYPVPATGEITYTIEIKRQGGAIKKDLGYVQSGSWGEVCPSCIIA